MNYSEMTRVELREYIRANPQDLQAFEAYMDKIDKEGSKTLIPDDIASDPVKFANFLSRNK